MYDHHLSNWPEYGHGYIDEKATPFDVELPRPDCHSHKREYHLVVPQEVDSRKGREKKHCGRDNLLGFGVHLIPFIEYSKDRT